MIIFPSHAHRCEIFRKTFLHRLIVFLCMNRPTTRGNIVTSTKEALSIVCEEV